METRKILSALSYFSIFFAGILFPLILLFISEDKAVKGHAKGALLSHLLTIIPIPFILFLVINHINSYQSNFPVLLIVLIIISILLSLSVFVWNIVKGIQVLTKVDI